MSLPSRVTSLWRNLFRRSRVERELDAELRGYVDLLIDEQMRAGASRDAATRAALLEVEGVDQVKERVRDVKAGVFLQTLWQDARYAWRMLVRQPGFSAAAILALALGIGATTAIFSVVDGVLLRPLPYAAPDRLVSIFMRFTPQNLDRGALSAADLLDLRAGASAYEEIGALTGGRLDLTGAGIETPEQIATTYVTPSVFSVLGVRPILGRTFLPGEEKPNGQTLLVLSEGLWRRRFQGDPSVLGRVVFGNGVPYTIVGVMPASFAYPRRDIEAWANLQLAPPTIRGPFMIWTVARLKPGVTVADAEAETRVIAARIEQADPNTYQNLSMPVVPLHDSVLNANTKTMLFVIFGAVAFVLLIALVNVANLLLARSAARGREMALRLSLGATRGRVLRQLLTESVLLALVGGVLGVALASAGLEVLRVTNAGSIPRIDEVALDLRVLAFTALISIGSGVLFGLTPALHSLRTSLTGALRDGDRSATAGASRRRAQGALIVAEIALSLMLLIGAGLLLRSFFVLQHVETGFTAPPTELLTMRLSPNQAKFNRPPENRLDERVALAYYDQVLALVRRIPGVESAAWTEALPPDRSDSTWYDSFVIEGQSPVDARRNPAVVIPTVSAEYARTLGVPLLRGRWFDAQQDTAESPLATVISQDMARRYFAGRDPIGTRITLSSLREYPMQIVGVVGDVKYTGLQEHSGPVYYRPLSQFGRRRLYLVVRTSLGASLLPTIRREIQSFDKDVVINRVNTMDRVIADSIAGPRFRMLLIGAFAAVALLLAVTGIYGVMAYSVAQRTHELGLRLALGAARADVLCLVLGQAIRLAVIGIALGVGGALLLTRWMSTLLFRIDPTDPLTFASVAAGLVGVALLASLLPARRATRIDPMVALRHE